VAPSGARAASPDGAPSAAARLARRGSLVVAVAFLSLGLATLADHGVTWDEAESYRAGAQDLRIVTAALTGRPLPPWPWHELPGYQFTAETLRAAFAAAANRLLWEPGSYLGFHLFNLLGTAVAVWLTGRLAARESGVAVVGPLAALLLALHPELIAHSQSNPKDGLGLLAWAIATTALSRSARRGGRRDFALLGVALGAALATHVGTVLLAPLAVAWMLLPVPVGTGGGHDPDRRGRQSGHVPMPSSGGGESRGSRLSGRLAGLLVAAAVAAPTAVLLWPWLWADPVRRTLELARRVGSFDVPMQVLYLGELWAPTELPWHYGLVSLVIASPVPLLAGAALGLAVAVRRRGGPLSRLARLATVWLGVVLVADLLAPARYDGARHLLPALPAAALLAAVGLVWAAGVTAGAVPSQGGRLARRPALVGVLVAASLLAVAWQLAAVHPYHDAFLSLPARAWLGPEAQRRVELEYWGGSYREGAEWLLAHAPADALVLVPMATHAATPYLAGRLAVVPRDRHPDDGRPQYLMVMTREAWYTPQVAAVVASRHPVFTVRRQGSTLLAVYRVR
jgi:hypothetical protein